MSLKEFTEFISQKNIFDLAIAVIIGSAFLKIVSSLVDDIVTPLVLTPVLKKTGVDEISELKWKGVLYGKFLSAIITFLVIAFVLFLIVKGMKKNKVYSY